MKKYILLLLVIFISISVVNSAELAVRKYGLISTKGEEITPVQFQKIERGKAMMNGKYALIDSLGNVMTDYIYDEIDESTNWQKKLQTLIPIKQGKKWGFLNPKTLEQVIPFQYDYYYTTNESLFIVSQNEMCGMINSESGEEVLPINYSKIDRYFDSGITKVYQPIIRSGIVSNTGRQIFPMVSYGVTIDDMLTRKLQKTVGHYAVRIDDKTGIIDSTGQFVVPYIYDYISSARANLWMVTQNKKVGFMNNRAELITPIKYKKNSYACSFGGGAVVIEKDDTFTYLDSIGVEKVTNACRIIEGGCLDKCLVVFTEKENYLIDYAGNRITRANESEIISQYWRQAKKEGLLGFYGFTDPCGKLMIPYEYDQTSYDFEEGYAVVGQRGIFGQTKYGIIDTKNEKVIPIEYEGVYIFSKNRFLLYKSTKKKIALSDEKGNLLTQFIYSDIHPLHTTGRGVCEPPKYDYYTVNKGKKVGLINSFGKEIIPCEYDQIIELSNNIASLKKDAKEGFMNLENSNISEMSYDRINFHGDKVLVEKNKKKGIVSRESALEIIPCEYDDIQILSKGVISAKNNGKWGVIDSDNKVKILFEYDNITDYYGDIVIVVK